MENKGIRFIAFYLPQFHPIPENDEWWGKGFTEWTSVAGAKPVFPGHYQPHIPADLGFYDLRLPESREAQADLARDYGIHGFCYYHYWFNGRRILERPFNEILSSGKPDFPFCLCWANENWTRVWDGGEKHILLEQKSDFEDDLAHIQSLIPAFLDKRYIRIDGKPLFLVYRTGLLPDPRRTAGIWREAAARAGVGDIYLARVESFTSHDVDPRELGFDASIEFEPDLHNLGKLKFNTKFHRALARAGVLSKGYVEHFVGNYNAVMQGMLNRPQSDFVRFHCVTPSWDNSPRRKRNAWILLGSNPVKYGTWLKEAVSRTKQRYKGDERIVFINAWNEWAEGNHLEPDLKWGRAYLEETLTALAANEEAAVASPENSGRHYLVLKRLYWKLNSFLSEQGELIKSIFSPKG